jgi:hypothetical protein
MRRFSCLLLICLVAGCGHSFISRNEANDLSIITGTVKLNGKPLAAGSITMVGTDGKAIREYIISDGTYRMNGVAPGPAKVLINGKEIPPPAEEPGPIPPVPPGKRIRLPDQYLSRELTPLTASIKPGKQEHNFDLTVDQAELDRLNPPGSVDPDPPPRPRRGRPLTKDKVPPAKEATPPKNATPEKKP